MQIRSILALQILKNKEELNNPTLSLQLPPVHKARKSNEPIGNNAWY